MHHCDCNCVWHMPGEAVLSHACLDCCHPCSGVRLKQKKGLVVPAAEALEVLEDEDMAAQGAAPARRAPAQLGTLRRRLDAGEPLLQDPLRLHKVGARPGSRAVAACHVTDAHAQSMGDLASWPQDADARGGSTLRLKSSEDAVSAAHGGSYSSSSMLCQCFRLSLKRAIA